MFRKMFVIVLGLALLGGFTVAEAHEEIDLELRVLVDASGSFDKATADSAIGIAFFVRGTICEDPEPGATCDAIGTFLCWGWQSDPSDVDGRPQVSVVSQEFNIFDRGKIQAQGVEAFGPDSARAVVGGTGDFRNVRGEVTGVILTIPPSTGTGEFVATFELVTDSRGSHHDDAGSAVLGGAGAIGWPMLAIGAAFGLLAWMRRRNNDD